MGRRRSYIPLNVFLNRKMVGVLARESSGAIHFQYDQSWLEWEHTMPVSLSLPLREDRYIGAPVMAVFDNLLPDNDSVRRRVAERTGAKGIDVYNLLSEIGRDCVGALQFLPDDEAPQAGDLLDGRPVDEAQIEAILNNLDMAPLGIRKETDFRISVAGAQEKTALFYRDGQWYEPYGTTPTTHIIKPQIGNLPNGMDLSNSVENEYLCLKLLGSFGLKVAKAEIATFGEKKALVVERFDRQWTRDGRLIRLPQEDMCQALSIPPSQKYQNEGGPGIVEIMGQLRGSDEPMKDRRDFLKVNILFWLMGATDGHAKNFSIALMPGGRFRLTPFYDVMSVQPSYDAGQIGRRAFKLAMRFGASKHYRVEEIQPRHIMETGQKAGLSAKVITDIFEELQEEADDALERTFEKLPHAFPQDLVRALKKSLKVRMEKAKMLDL